MHYNSTKQNNEYYDAYRKTYAQESKSQKLNKILFTLLAVVLLLASIFYLYYYFNPIIENKTTTTVTDSHPKETFLIREENLPQSIQLTTNSESPSAIDKKDIELIVKLVMLQIKEQEAKALTTETLNEESLEKQLQESEKNLSSPQNFQETNYYNKVVIEENQNNELANASLSTLSNRLATITNGEESLKSNYSQSIQKELIFRENEMRVIIVQEGDSLSKIAQKAYGDYKDYPKIFKANPEIVKNPNKIFAGQHLRIPS